MMYVIWDHERGPLRRVDGEPGQLGEGERAIPCDGTDWRTQLSTMEELRAAKLAELADARWRAETGGMSMNGMTIRTDRESQALITGAALQASVDAGYVCRWKTAEGFATLDAAMILTVAGAVRAHVQAQFDREAELAAQVGAAQTVEEVQSVQW